MRHYKLCQEAPPQLSAAKPDSLALGLFAAFWMGSGAAGSERANTAQRIKGGDPVDDLLRNTMKTQEVDGGLRAEHALVSCPQVHQEREIQIIGSAMLCVAMIGSLSHMVFLGGLN